LNKSKSILQNLNNIYGKALLILVIIIIGALLRIFPFEAFVQEIPKDIKSAGQYIVIKGDYKNLIEDKVSAFYNNIDTGKYEEAFNNSIEPVWENNMFLDKNLNIGNNKVIGFRNTEELVERTVRELGNNGEKINIFDSNILTVLEINDYKNDYGNLLDIAILDKISEFKEIDNILIASVEGQLFNCTFCGKIKWQKDLVIIKFKDEKDLKIFLNGSNNISGIYYTEWFVNRLEGEYITS
jgi:hypothetical protein